MSLEREFLFISVRHSHLILPGIPPPSSVLPGKHEDNEGDDEQPGERMGGEKLLSREDVTEMAEQRLQNYGAYLNIGEPSTSLEEKSLSEAAERIPLERERHKLGEHEGWGTCRSKLQRFNKSIHPRGGVKSLTGRGGEGEREKRTEDYDKPKKMKKIGEPVQCVPVHRFEIKYVNVTISFSFP